MLMGRLASSGLLRPFGCFTAWVFIEWIRFAAKAFVPSSAANSEPFFILEVARLAALTLTAVEIYRIITREIFQPGRTRAVVTVAALAFAATLAAPVSGDLELDLLVFLFVALSALIWFYARFPIPVASYVWHHALIFLLYLGTQAVGARSPAASMYGTWICLLAWLWAFSGTPDQPTPAGITELEIANRRARSLERTVDQ
jgi:hypothetical protein